MKHVLFLLKKKLVNLYKRKDMLYYLAVVGLQVQQSIWEIICRRTIEFINFNPRNTLTGHGDWIRSVYFDRKGLKIEDQTLVPILNIWFFLCVMFTNKFL